jgi:hypothetical protein
MIDYKFTGNTPQERQKEWQEKYSYRGKGQGCVGSEYCVNCDKVVWCIGCNCFCSYASTCPECKQYFFGEENVKRMNEQFRNAPTVTFEVKDGVFKRVVSNSSLPV